MEKIKIERLCGIYYLLREDEIVYIGQSTNILFRVATHLNLGVKVFDSYMYELCTPQLLDKLELESIIKHKPLYNVSLPACSEYTTMNAVRKSHGVNLWTIKRHILKNKIVPVMGGHYHVKDFIGVENA